MPLKSQNPDELRTRLGQISGWQTATRDDAGVALELYQTRSVDRVHGLSEAAFFDEFFCYLREIGVMELLKALDPAERKGALYPFVQFVLFTIMRCVGGVQSMLATHDVLLTDEALMGVLGFNATQVEFGSNKRGLDRCQQPVQIRGPLCYETVADNIVRIGPQKLTAMFNGAIRSLAAQGLFAKNLDVVLDATDDEATPSYKTSDGRDLPHVVREKRPDVRANRHAKKIEVRVWGWKIWVVWESQAKVPLALIIDGINEPDNKHALAVIRMARENVKGYATIRSVALDRGFLDGKLLSQIELDGILVYIPAKSNMNITRDAREIARRAAAAHASGQTIPGCLYRERHQTRIHGAGKNATREILTTTLVGIQDMPCDWWTSEGLTSESNSKSFEPKLLHAVVVLRWDGAAKDAEKEVVLLTTNPALDPFVTFDAYDDRSLIENTCNREAKEKWFLEHHPKRSEAAVYVHAFFVFLTMALIAGYRAYKSKTDEAERLGQDTGIARYRRELEAKNRDKVAVFIDGRFGIFRSFEFAVLGGVMVRERAVMGETASSVLRRYGVDIPETDSS